MMTVYVYLRNSHDRQLERVEISREEILQFATRKVEDMYEKGYWETINSDEIKLNTNI